MDNRRYQSDAFACMQSAVSDPAEWVGVSAPDGSTIDADLLGSYAHVDAGFCPEEQRASVPDLQTYIGWAREFLARAKLQPEPQLEPPPGENNDAVVPHETTEGGERSHPMLTQKQVLQGALDYFHAGIASTVTELLLHYQDMEANDASFPPQVFASAHAVAERYPEVFSEEQLILLIGHEWQRIQTRYESDVLVDDLLKRELPSRHQARGCPFCDDPHLSVKEGQTSVECRQCDEVFDADLLDVYDGGILPERAEHHARKNPDDRKSQLEEGASLINHDPAAAATHPREVSERRPPATNKRTHHHQEQDRGPA